MFKETQVNLLRSFWNSSWVMLDFISGFLFILSFYGQANVKKYAFYPTSFLTLKIQVF